MALFQQYQNGVQPVTGLSEAGANIGKMYQQGISSLGGNLAEGIKDYYKNKAEDAQITEEGDQVASQIRAIYEFNKDNPEMGQFNNYFHEQADKMSGFHGMSLAQKRGALNSAKTAIQSVAPMIQMQQQANAWRTAQAMPDALAGTTSIKTPTGVPAHLPNFDPSKSVQENVDNIHSFLDTVENGAKQKGIEYTPYDRNGIINNWIEKQKQNVQGSQLPFIQKARLNDYLSAYQDYQKGTYTDDVENWLKTNSTADVNINPYLNLNGPKENTGVKGEAGQSSGEAGPSGNKVVPSDNEEYSFGKPDNFLGDLNYLFNPLRRMSAPNPNPSTDLYGSQAFMGMGGLGTAQDLASNPVTQYLNQRPQQLPEIVKQQEQQKELEKQKQEALNEQLYSQKEAGIENADKYDIGETPVEQERSLAEQKMIAQKWYKDHFGYVPSSFEGMWQQMHPESQLRIMKTSAGTFYHDGKEWKPAPQPDLKQQLDLMNRQVGGMDINGNFVPKQIGNTGLYVAGTIVSGDPDAVKTKLRSAGTSLSMIKGLEDLMNKSPNGRTLSFESRAQAEQYVQNLRATLRGSLFPSGRVAEWEQQILDKMVPNPTGVFTLDNSTRASFDKMKEFIKNDIQNTAEDAGLRVHDANGVTASVREEKLKLALEKNLKNQPIKK